MIASVSGGEVKSLLQPIYASITLDNKLHYLGSFTNELAAAIAYNEKAKEFHGEFAVLNSF